MARKVFYSFHYDNDVWRAAQIKSIGVIEGNKPVSANDWEEVKRGGDAAIKRWIDNQLYGRSCTVVLVGAETANRPYINYEIVESWDKRMGVVGIYIHNIKNQDKQISLKGQNPFDYIKFPSGTKLSSVVKLYDPWDLYDSPYEVISKKISSWIEEAIKIREMY